MKRILLLLTVLAAITFANPTISNIAHESLDASGTIRIAFTVSPASFVWLKYGLSSGSYPYTTQSSGSTQTNTAFALTGLKSGATYYYVIEARPNINDDCSVVSTCTTSTERSFTVPVATHPVDPTPPTTWMPSHPDTTGYTVVPMDRDNATGDCKAKSTVSGTNPSWTVNAGDVLDTVIAKVGYGTVIEFDQGVVCEPPEYVKVDNADMPYGYFLPKKSVDPLAMNVDDPAHRWIVLRTKQVNSGDFPPFGTRTGPTWTKNAAFKSTRSQVYIPSRNWTFSVVGNIIMFDTGPGPVHHYWLENLDFVLDPSVTAVVSDGVLSTRLVVIDRNSGDVQANPPKYNVFDRIHMVGSGANVAGTPHYGCTNMGWDLYASYLALLGTYTEGIDCPDRADTMGRGILVREGAPGPLTFDNNYLSAIGMGFYMETNDAVTVPHDVTFTRNLMYWPWKHMKPNTYTPSNNWDGKFRMTRQQWESKGCIRCKIDGNIIDGSWAYQNEGPAILINGNSNPSPGAQGNKDYIITNNLIRRTANVVNCDAIRFMDPPYGPPDVAPTSRVLMQNNLAYDVGRRKYQQPGNLAGVWSNYLTGNCSDWKVDKNTFGWNDHGWAEDNISFVPLIMAIGYGGTPTQGFSFTDNVYYLSFYTQTNSGGTMGNAGVTVASHPMTPNLNQGGTWKQQMDSIFGYLDSGGLVPAYNWTGNIGIGGTVDTYSPTLRDMTGAEVTTLKANMPGTDTWAAGNTKAAREAAVGIVASADPRVAYGGLAKGANVNTLYSAMGVTQNVTVATANTALTFGYKAPDTRACVIDTSADGVNWNRTTDAGGSTTRSTTVSGLSSNTAYQYKILCYYEQTSSYDLWASSDLTNGSATTGGEAPTPSSSDSHVRGKVIVRGKAVLR